MELGTWGIIKEGPSLIALIPMVVYIVLAFNEKINQFITIMISVIIGCILTGNGVIEFGKAFAGALDSTIGQIGLIIALGTGVGSVMTKTGVSKTLCQWIIKGIGVNSEKKAIIAIEICCVVICGLLGTLAGGCAIIAPVLIPVVAAVGLTPNTVGCVFQSSGETGLIWGPFSGPVITLMALTGLTYGQQMLWAALPYGIIWLVVIYFCGLYVQKKTVGKYSYELAPEDIDATEITPREKRTSVAFVVTFTALVVYAIITKAGMAYVIPVMFILALVMVIFSGKTLNECLGEFFKGVGSAAGMWVIFIALEPSDERDLCRRRFRGAWRSVPEAGGRSHADHDHDHRYAGRLLWHQRRRCGSADGHARDVPAFDRGLRPADGAVGDRADLRFPRHLFNLSGRQHDRCYGYCPFH